MTSRGVALAAALLALAWSGCGSTSSPTYTVRHGAAVSPAAARSPARPAAEPLRVLHLADFGDATRQQAAVAAAVAAAHRRTPFDLALFPGDLIYPCGPSPGLPGAGDCTFAADDNTVAPGTTTPDDPAFQLHEGPLAPLAAPPGVEVFLALGNHDVAACGDQHVPDPRRTRACLAVARRTPLWRMPGRHYVVDRGPVRFLVVDTNLAVGDYGGFAFEDEVRFVAEESRPCAERLCFLVGHHPPLTAGTHAAGDSARPRFLERIDQLLAAGEGRIRGFLAGHDHDLQHLRTTGGLDVFVSGNGARGRPSERFERLSRPQGQLFFASVRWGFGVLEVDATGWRYRFEADDGAPLHCCAAAGRGPCEPAACW